MHCVYISMQAGHALRMMMTSKAHGSKNKGKQPRGEPRGPKGASARKSARTSVAVPALPAELSAGSDMSDSECPSPGKTWETGTKHNATSGGAQIVRSQTTEDLLKKHKYIPRIDPTVFFTTCDITSAPQQDTRSSAAPCVETKSLQQVALDWVLNRAQKDQDRLVLDALERRHELKKEKLEKLGHIIFRRKSTEKQRRLYFRKFAWCLSRGQHERALDAYIEREDLPDTDWYAENCQLRKDVEALALLGRNTIPGFFITTILQDKRI